MRQMELAKCSLEKWESARACPNVYGLALEEAELTTFGLFYVTVREVRMEKEA